MLGPRTSRRREAEGNGSSSLGGRGSARARWCGAKGGARGRRLELVGAGPRAAARAQSSASRGEAEKRRK